MLRSARLRGWIGLALIAPFMVVTLWPGAPHRPAPGDGPPWWWVTPIEGVFWGNFTHVAAVSGAACLAYLALEVFRHNRAVNDLIRDALIDQSSEEKRGVAAAVEIAEDVTHKMQIADLDRSVELLVILRIFQLCQARRAWIRGPMVAEAGRQAIKQEDLDSALLAAKQKAELFGWFGQGAGRLFLHEFHIGADAVIVSMALLLSFWVHLLASLEQITLLYVPVFFLEPTFGVFFTYGLAILGCAVPLSYAVLGRSVMDVIRETADRAQEQYASAKKKIELNDDDIIKARATKSGQPSSAKDTKTTAKPKRPSRQASKAGPDPN